MKHSYIKILGSTQEQIQLNSPDQENYEESQQIQQIRLALKKLYFQKRTILVDTFIQILNENGKPTEQIQNLKLPQNIQKQREQYFTIKQKINKLNSKQNNNDLSISQEEPFNKVKQRIFNKYKLKRKYHDQMRHKDLIEDSLKVERKIILDIYKEKLKEFYKLDNHQQQMQDDPRVYKKNKINVQKGLKSSIGTNKNIRFLQKGSYFQSVRGGAQSNYEKKSNKGPIDANKESIVLENLKNPNTGNFMKINDSNMELNESINEKNSQSVDNLIYDFIENDKQYSLKGQSHKINASFQQSGYRNYLNEQKKQLQEQKKRMLKLTQQANNIISNQTLTDSQEQVQNLNNQYCSQENRKFQSEKNYKQNDLSFEETSQIKCLFAQIIDLFIVSEVLKFQIQNRTFQMISKLFQNASIDYNQKIQLRESINLTTFTLAVKSLLKDNYEYRSDVDLIVNKIFKGKTELEFQQFSNQLKSVLNKKEVQMFQSIDNKNEVDRTIQKTKRLFLTWISISYFQKRIKQILRKNQFIVTTIMKQCAIDHERQNFDSGLLEEFFCQKNTFNIQKITVHIYFKHILGKQLKTKNFIQWYSNNYQYTFSKRYQTKITKSNQKSNQ